MPVSHQNLEGSLGCWEAMWIGVDLSYPLHCPALHAVVGLILAFCPGGLPGQVGSGQEVRTVGLQAPHMLTSFPVFHTSWPGVPQGLLSRRSKKGLKHPPGPLIERIQCKGVEGKSI